MDQFKIDGGTHPSAGPIGDQRGHEPRICFVPSPESLAMLFRTVYSEEAIENCGGVDRLVHDLLYDMTGGQVDIEVRPAT